MERNKQFNNAMHFFLPVYWGPSECVLLKTIFCSCVSSLMLDYVTCQKFNFKPRLRNCIKTSGTFVWSVRLRAIIIFASSVSLSTTKKKLYFKIEACWCCFYDVLTAIVTTLSRKKWQIAFLGCQRVISIWEKNKCSSKTIIELDYRKIFWFITASQIDYLPRGCFPAEHVD